LKFSETILKLLENNLSCEMYKSKIIYVICYLII
jgi:hypothetical protein